MCGKPALKRLTYEASNQKKGGSLHDRSGVSPLFDQYHNMIYRLALTSLRSIHDAEDMVQTVFLKLLDSDPPCPRQGEGLVGPGDGERLPGPGPGQKAVGVGTPG